MRLSIFKHIGFLSTLFFFLGAPSSQATEELLDGIPSSVNIAEGFDFIPVTSTVRDVRDYFNENGGTVSDFALVGPTVMAAPPGVDGHLFVATQRGQIFHVAFERDDNDHPVFTSMEPVLDIRDKVSAAIDRGLIGMAVHPDFENGTGRLYLSYTHANGDLDGYYETTCFDDTLGARPCTDVKKKTAGLAWYQIDDYVGDPESEHLILGTVRGTPEAPSCSDYAPDADCIYSDSGSHTVGSVAFDPETGAVCLATGDGAGFYQAEPDAVRAARMDNLSGKLLCVDPDTGKGLRSNPYWTGNPNDFASKTVVYGLRNPYRFSFSDERDLVIYMVGWNQVESVYRIEPDDGGYVGWPCHGVETGVTDYQFLSACDFEAPEPVIGAQYQYDHPPENDYQAAIVGAAHFGAAYPEWLEGRYLAGDYRNDWIRILGTDEDTGLWVDDIDLAYGTDPDNPIELGAPVMFYNDTAGRVYMLSFLSGVVDGFTVGTIYEIVYTEPVEVVEPEREDVPEVAVTAAGFEFEPVEGDLTFSFDCAQSIIRGLAVSEFRNVQCRWDFGDDSPVVDTQDPIVHQFAVAENYLVRLSLIAINGRVIASANRSVQVASPQNQPNLIVYDMNLPDYPVAISESFNVGISVLNNGAGKPFCALLDVVNSDTGNSVREIRRCTTLTFSARTNLSFPLFFSDPGNFTLSVRFHATTSDLPTADPIAYLGQQLLGSLGIQNRSGTTEPLIEFVDLIADENDSGGDPGPGDDTSSNPFGDDELPANDDPVTDELFADASSSSGGSSGGSVSVLLLMLLCIAHAVRIVRYRRPGL